MPPLNDFKIYPRMAHWFRPWLLTKLLNNVIVSSMFGQYADRRLTIAALDTVSTDVLVERATSFSKNFTPDGDGAVWLDFVADLGDGFDSTYAVASLLARDELALGDLKLPRGQALIMGGDQVYPTASTQAYRNQLRQPYAWAFPDRAPKSDAGVPLLAIPGNHDWYDGLVLFLAFFCRERSVHFGNWRASQHQRRSYFAIQITDTWWLWGTDIQLANDMDQPQADYFRTIARSMPDNSRIILCSAEPGWLYAGTSSAAWNIANYAISFATNEGRGLSVPIIVSGDTHHYSRYSGVEGRQFITSGGGGAFLHPTHQLQDKITIKWNSVPKELSLTTSPDAGHQECDQPACYPSKADSKKLVKKNLAFAFTNWDFSLLMGAIYFLMGVGLTLRDEWDAYIIVTLIFAAAIMGYTVNQEKSRSTKVLISSAVHALAHAAVVILATRFFSWWNGMYFDLQGQWYSVWKWLGILLVEMGTTGFLIGSTIFGLNLFITCRWLGMNTNDAFSAFRLGRYNNFLRFKITGDKVEIYAVGLTDVPDRDDWIANPTPNYVRGKTPGPVFVPRQPLQPHLIERVVL